MSVRLRDEGAGRAFHSGHLSLPTPRRPHSITEDDDAMATVTFQEGPLGIVLGQVVGLGLCVRKVSRAGRASGRLNNTKPLHRRQLGAGVALGQIMRIGASSFTPC